MGRFLGEGTCFLFDSEPIDLPDNRILCRTSRDYCRTIGLLSYNRIIVVQSDYCRTNRTRTAGFVIRLLTKLAAYNAGRLQICRNDWPERKTVVDKRYALRNSVGVIPVRDLNMVVKYSALSK